jgi:hypothetical protein
MNPAAQTDVQCIGPVSPMHFSAGKTLKSVRKLVILVQTAEGADLLPE